MKYTRDPCKQTKSVGALVIPLKCLFSYSHEVFLVDIGSVDDLVKEG